MTYQEALNLAYADSETRKRATKAERIEAMEAVLHSIMSSHDFDGMHGKAFDIKVRRYLNPDTILLRVARPNQADARKGGKEIEVKSGNGEICKIPLSFGSPTLDLVAQFIKWDYIAYSVDASLESARVYSRAEFIELLGGFTSKTGKPMPDSLFKRQSGSGHDHTRIMLNNVRSDRRYDYITSATLGTPLEDWVL